MSYFDRSVPIEVGKAQRELFGKDMFERVKNTINRLNFMGIEIEHQILIGRSHNDNYGLGVNELSDQIIHDCYMSSISDKKTL